MKITVTKNEQGAIVIAFDETKVTLNGAETKTLLLGITKILLPEGAMGKSAAQRADEFIQRIKAANDLGIQKFLRVAEHDDLLVLLKIGEGDTDLAGRVYGNMTEKSHKIFAEDLAYRFEAGVSDEELGKAIARLTVVARDLENEGTLQFGN